MRTHTTIARTLAVALAALAAGACSDATTPVAPAVPSSPSLGKNAQLTNGRIYFSSNFAGTGHEVYSVKSDGSDRRRLTYTADQEYGLDVTRDGKKLVVAGYSNGFTEVVLHTMNVDGTNRRLVLRQPGFQISNPAWSPDGRTIAFAMIPLNSGESAIWTVSANGGKATQLTPAGQNASFPSWSPDGAYIAYAVTPADNRPDLHIMNADGSDAKLLVECAESCWSPAWSRDGTRIVYITFGQTAQIQSCAMQQAVPSICAVPMATGVSTLMFALAPDGSQLVFRSDGLDELGMSERVTTVNVNGSSQAFVTGNLHSIGGLAWGR